MPQKTERNAEIIRLYKTGGLSMDKIGAKFGIHGSRVAQIVKAAGQYTQQNGEPHAPRSGRMPPLVVDEAREEWRPAFGYEGRVEVSSFGRVRDTATSRIKTLLLAPTGYVVVSMPGGRQVRVHRLVARAFIPNPEALPEVNHLDTVRSYIMLRRPGCVPFVAAWADFSAGDCFKGSGRVRLGRHPSKTKVDE